METFANHIGPLAKPILVYNELSERPANDLVGTLFLVVNDPAPTNNGLYYYSGAAVGATVATVTKIGG